MFVRRSLLVIALALSVVRCADQPTAVRPSSGPQFLKWSTTPDFTAQTNARQRRSGAMALTPPLSLDNYTVSFWAVRGESRSVQINYSSSIDSGNHPFLSLTASDPVFAPGVGDIAMGDSVLITVVVDTTNIGVRFEPTGLQFGSPASFKIWYGGASGDLNGDAVVDSTDAAVEAQLLGLWYREDESEPWTHLPAVQSVEEKSFSYGLAHFSIYAVAAELLEWAVQF